MGGPFHKRTTRFANGRSVSQTEDRFRKFAAPFRNRKIGFADARPISQTIDSFRKPTIPFTNGWLVSPTDGFFGSRQSCRGDGDEGELHACTISMARMAGIEDRR